MASFFFLEDFFKKGDNGFVLEFELARWMELPNKGEELIEETAE